MRTAGIVAAVVVLVGLGAVALSLVANDRDSASVSAGEGGPGTPRAEDPKLGAAAAVDVPGNVVLVHSAAADGPALQALAQEIAGPASQELEQAGQAVIVRRDPQSGGIVAVTDTRVLRVDDPSDPQLRAFVEAWLGRSGDEDS